jgi:hydrogenase maturation protease
MTRASPVQRIYWMSNLFKSMVNPASHPVERTADTLVLALGNPLRGDDGVGAAVLEQLAQVDLPPGVELLEGGTPGLETVLLLQGYRRAIIVDAAAMGREPGEWARLLPGRDAELQADDLYLRGTLHYAGLAEALALGEALAVLPEEIVIYGIQPTEIGWSPGLSAVVQAAIPAVCQSIVQELV